MAIGNKSSGRAAGGVVTWMLLTLQAGHARATAEFPAMDAPAMPYNIIMFKGFQRLLRPDIKAKYLRPYHNFSLSKPLFGNIIRFRNYLYFEKNSGQQPAP